MLKERSGAGWIADVVVLAKETKMKKEEGEAERRVKGKGREGKEAKRLWIKCLGGGDPSRGGRSVFMV